MICSSLQPGGTAHKKGDTFSLLISLVTLGLFLTPRPIWKSSFVSSLFKSYDKEKSRDLLKVMKNINSRAENKL